MAVIALSAAAQGQTFPEPRTQELNERVYVLLGPIQHANKLNQGYMINSTVIVGDKGVILVDSEDRDEVGRHHRDGSAPDHGQTRDARSEHAFTMAITTSATWRSKEPR